MAQGLSTQPKFTRGGFVAAAVGVASGFVALPGGAEGATTAITYGSRGPAVRALNERLAALTYLPAGEVGSVFTDATFHALVAFQKYEGLAADGVAGPRTCASLRRARRPRPASAGRPRRVEVLLDRQVALLIDRASVQRVVAVSTGRRGYATARGRFAVYRRERLSWSTPYRVWLPWAAYFHGGIAFHEYADVPPYPASHGCVRVPPPFASELYRSARLGTRVHVI